MPFMKLSVLLTSSLLAFGPVLLLTTPAHAQTAAEAALLAGGCVGCHGVSGQGGQGIPSIRDTQTRAEFVAAMQAFRANQREATVMGRISRGYTDAEITTLAAFYARAQ